jgi:hypothetical protein
MPQGAARIVNAVRDLMRARYMQDFCEVMPILSRDVVWGESIHTRALIRLRPGAYACRLLCFVAPAVHPVCYQRCHQHSF